MTQRKPTRRPRPRSTTARLAGLALTLAAGVSLHSCAELPARRELLAAGARLQALLTGLGTAVRQQAGQASGLGAPSGLGSVPAPAGPPRSASTGSTARTFSACPQFFAGGQPPVVKPQPSQRALCYDAFAILHSGQSKTAVYIAQKLNRAAIADAGESAPTSSSPMRACPPPNAPSWRTTAAAATTGVTWRQPARCRPRRPWPRAFRWPTWCPRPRSTTRAPGACRSRMPPRNMRPGRRATCM